MIVLRAGTSLRRLHLPGLLFGAVKLFLKTWNYFSDEVFETRGGHADERTLDVVPCFQGFVLLTVCSRVGLTDGLESGKTSLSAAGLAASQHRRQQDAAAEGHT